MRRMIFSPALVLSLLATLAPAAPPDTDPPAREPAQFADAEVVREVRSVVSGMLTRLPNYTCLETLEQTARAPGQSKFRLVDRVRVEVAYVDGTELYAFPGSPRFDSRELQQIITTHGAFGTGDFGEHLRATYGGNLPLLVAGRELMLGRDAWRFTQIVPANLSRYDVIVPPARATVAYAATAWHDTATLALLRIELLATRFPLGFPVRRVFKATEYSSVTVNGVPVRLPAMTELSMTTRNGIENRTVSTFSNCREYKGESKLTFEEPASDPAGLPPQSVETLSLPAGLEVSVRLDDAVELTQAARGDLIAMTVVKDVVKKGRKLLSSGAKVMGRWQYFGCEDRPIAYCFATLSTESFEDGTRSGPFAATLESPSWERDTAYGGRSFNQGRDLIVPEEIKHLKKDVSALYTGIITKLPRGYRLIWRTLEVSGGSKP